MQCKSNVKCNVYKVKRNVYNVKKTIDNRRYKTTWLTDENVLKMNVLKIKMS